MAIVPALDLRPKTAATPDYTPANIEAEQALLGIILFQPAVLDDLDVELKPEHFFEPFHGRVLAEILAVTSSGLAVDPLLIAEPFRRDPVFAQMGGILYFVDLIDKAPPAFGCSHFARAIIEHYNRRRLITLADEIRRQAMATHDDDGETLTSGAIMDMAEAEITAITRADPKLAMTSIADAAEDVMDAMTNPDAPQGVETGIRPLHQLLGPLLPGELTLIAGRPGMGKSAVACSVALRIAAPEWWEQLECVDDPDGYQEALDIAARYGLHRSAPAGVMEINGEMSRDQIMRRHLTDVGFAMFGPAFPQYADIRNRHVDATQWDMLRQVVDLVSQWPITILKRSGLKISQIRSIARRQMAKWRRAGIKPGALILDHGGLLRAEDGRVSRYEAQTQIAIDLKVLADDLGISIIALLQLSRAVENRDNKRPELSDLRDSGGWEENADHVIFPFRDSYYAAREKEPDRGSPGSEQDAKWAAWDSRVKSKEIEFIPGKVREGKAAFTTKGWLEIGHNALRSCKPSHPGVIL